MRWAIPILLSFASTAAADHNWEQRDIVAGQSLYADNCASCHGANLEGQPNWRSLNADGVLPARRMMEQVTRGITTMNCCSNTPSWVALLH
jgi:cytochrome c